MITTVCLNPTFDRTVSLSSLQPGTVHRAISARTDAGGKGINVALVLKNLGSDVQCLWCSPEEGGAQLAASLDKHGLKHIPMPVSGAVRTNLKIVSREGTTDINENGALMTPEALERVFSACESHAKGSRYAAVTGSVPPGCPKGTCRDLIRRMDVPTILDVSGEELLLGLEAKPWLIKPNNEELEKTLGTPVSSPADICAAADKLLQLGAQNVLVSMGGDGAMLFTAGKIYRSDPVEVPVRSTVGAGDAMVAGMLYGMEETGDLMRAFAYGTAAGSAAVTMEGTQPFAKEDFDGLLKRVRIQEVSL